MRSFPDASRSRRLRTSSTMTDTPLSAFRSSWPARRTISRTALTASLSVTRASVTQIGVVRRCFYDSDIGMRLRLVLLDRLDEPIDDVAGVGDRKLREQKAELLYV